jgi:hypothetical protein
MPRSRQPFAPVGGTNCYVYADNRQQSHGGAPITITMLIVFTIGGWLIPR